MVGHKVKLLRRIISTSALMSVSLLLSACAVLPKGLDSQGQDDGKRFSRKVVTSLLSDQPSWLKDLSETNFVDELNVTYTRGDILRIQILGMEQHSGLYQVTKKGVLDLPFARSLSAMGLSRSELIKNIELELVNLKWFYKDTVKVDLSLVQHAPINVSVNGAVFNPGRVAINGQPISKPEDVIRQLSGAFTSGRDLVAALTAAGGLRPDADASTVYVKRGRQVLTVKLTPLIDGSGFAKTPALSDGDQVFVPSTGVVDTALIKPSQITPPGIRVFMSNLTAPALTNAQSAVGADSSRLPYGVSLLDSVISANCVGGTHQANASRSVVLVTRNYGSNQQLVVRRTINQLLAGSSIRSINPFMMPNDGISCYDSRFTNFRDVARGIGEVISPILLGRLL